MDKKSIKLIPAIIATGIMSFAGVLIETAMNVTFPTLIQEFGVTTGQVQWVTTIYLLVISILVPFSNYLLKKFSIRSLFIVANLFFIVGLVIDFFALNFPMLLAGRLLQGISTGIALPLMFHIILTFTTIDKRGTMMGIGTMTTSIAPAIGPTYGGLLTSNLSWHYIFLLLIPVLSVSLIIGLFAIPEIKVTSDSRLDIVGLAGVMLLFTGFLMFLNQIHEWQSLFWLAVGIVGLCIFYYQSTHAKEPLVRLTVLKQQSFRLFLIGFLVCQALLLGVSFVLPNFVQIVLGENAFVAGLIMLPGAAIGAILAPFSGNLLDRVGSKKPILIGLTLAIIGWAALTLILQKPLLLTLVIGHVTYMIGIGLSYSNMMTTGMNHIQSADYGDGNTLFNTLQQFSGAVSTAVVATIIGIAQANNPDTVAATTTGSEISMILLLVAVVAITIRYVFYFRKVEVSKKSI
ncbi:MFS transporter [Enterococcus saccharolyticus]|uniref:MFS transporter n=1 Tax=Enterococcus TaxID=1350 RepID=UPI001E39EDAB|nr:MFS transporter [Enterococcus saccharolyticus]MCD5003480.1 MFS transporter [Enterococcus saccharolyticus]